MKSMSTMCHKPSRRPARYRVGFAMLNMASPKSLFCFGRARQQKGFALPTAIFLLVVLAALGVFMLMISSVQHTTSAQDVQGSRAYQAARAGIEWGLYTVMAPENTNPAAAPFVNQFNCPAAPAVIGNLNALNGTLAGFNVEIICTRNTYAEGGNQVSVYQLTSTATNGVVGSTTYVQRQLSVTIGTCRQMADGACCYMNEGAAQGCTGG